MKLTQRLILILAASACVLAAQDDPPSRIARLSYIYGNVSFRPGDVDDWYPAFVNRPLTTGDHVYVDFAGTAELHFDSGAMRLGSKTTMDILNLDDGNTQLRLNEGTLLIHVRSMGDQDSFEIDTPNLAFSLLRTGTYRIDVKPERQTTTVTVRGGAAELNGPDQSFTVRAGEQVLVSGTGDRPNYQTYGLPAPDTLDNFAAQRDQREEQSVSAQYCSRDMVGYEDLDKYGSWREGGEYGMVWVPSGMPAGWAPYHYGHWAWVDPWGWTWVDDAPWGFAPFHYGRWAYVGNTWGWVPGPRAERPVYAPALVAWVGGGGGGVSFGVGAGIGAGVAWFPLGPREVYVPSYRTSQAYVTRVNVTNTVIQNNINITNVNVTNVNYVNRNAPGAVMAVQREAFVNARPVQSAAIAVRPDQVRSATVVSGASIAPTRASLVRPRDPAVRVAQPAPAVLNQPVIAKRTPPPPPVPFVQKQAALANNGGKPLERSQMLSLRPTPPPQPLVRQVQARPVQERQAPQAQQGQQQAQPGQRPPVGNLPPPQPQGRPIQQQQQQQQPPPPSTPQRQVAPVQPPPPAAAPQTLEQRRQERDERKTNQQDRTPPPPQERTPPPQRTATPPPPPPPQERATPPPPQRTTPPAPEARPTPPPPAREGRPAPEARPTPPPPAREARPAPQGDNRLKREEKKDKDKKDEQQK